MILEFNDQELIALKNVLHNYIAICQNDDTEDEIEQEVNWDCIESAKRIQAVINAQLK